MTQTPKRVLFANPWWHEDIVNGTVRNAARRGWHLDLQTCLSGKLPEHWDGDGIITMLGGNPKSLEKLLNSAACPAVSLNTNYPEIDIPRVTQDDELAGVMAAEHFIERGFDSFAYYSHGASRLTSLQRLDAFERAIAKHDSDVTRLRWHTESHGPERSWAERQIWLRQKLTTLEKPVAIFATNDQAAAEVIEACIAESIAVPDEVAVLGMLDMAIFRESTTVPLSSIQVDFKTITATACDLLADMMNGAPAPREPIVFPPTGIAIRASTDTVAARSPIVQRAVRYMREHYAQSITVTDLATISGVSKTLMYDAFSEDLGETPHAVLTRLRLEHAKRRLLDGREKMETIARSCGFGDPTNLYRNFKQHVGTSPAAYRKKTRAEGAG